MQSYIQSAYAFGRAGITPSVKVHTSAFEEINLFSCKSTMCECSNTTLNWATDSIQHIAQREGRVNKHIFCTCKLIFHPSFRSRQYLSTTSQLQSNKRKKTKRNVTFFFSNRHHNNELQLSGDTLQPGSLAVFLQSWIWPVSKTPWSLHPQNKHSALTK